MDIFFPLKWIADFSTYNLFGFSLDSYYGSALNFFIYDTLKIGLLLTLINYLMAIVRYYLPVEKIREILTKRKWYGFEYLLAALLGVITPFCSCSSIPLFIGFVGAGLPLGVTFTFLISSPLINESSLALFPAMFGIKTTLIYNFFGIFFSVLVGILIHKLKLERFISREVFAINKTKRVLLLNKKIKPSFDLMWQWSRDGMKITKSIFPYVLMGVGVGAIIHGFVPQNFIENHLASTEWWTIPFATIIGIPLYANSVSVIPVIDALITKGIPIGTMLAFMTAVVTLSIPEMLMLKKVMRWQLLAIFMIIATIGIMILGYLFNWFSYIGIV